MLHQFYTFSIDVVSNNTEHLNLIILGLGTYFYLVNTMPEQKCAMSCGMRKLHGFKVRLYAARLNDLNEYLATFHGTNASETICEV